MCSTSNAIFLFIILSTSCSGPTFAAVGVTPRFDRASNRCVLEARPSRKGKPVVFRLRTVCRFIEKLNAWQKLAAPPQSQSDVKNQNSIGNSSKLDLSAFIGTEPPALFAFMWTENGVESSQMLTCGGILCNDISLPPPPAGQVAACVPGATSARAQFVPDFKECLKLPD